MPRQATANVPAKFPTAHDLTFGVEIECYLPWNNAIDIQVGSYHAGIQVPGLPPGWNAQMDGSIHARQDMKGFELVSPKLQGGGGASQLALVYNWLKEKGVKVYANCGFHVHVGLGAWLNPINLDKLVMLAKYWEPALYAITGTLARQEGHYCKPRKEDDIDHIWRKTRDNNWEAIKARIGCDADKYRLLNLASLMRIKTVEWRCFPGVADLHQALAYVQIVLALCEAACGPISLGSMKKRPEGRLCKEMGQHRYMSLFRELVRYCWRVPAREGSVPRGVIAPDSIPECVETLRKLTEKYQKAAQAKFLRSEQRTVRPIRTPPAQSVIAGEMVYAYPSTQTVVIATTEEAATVMATREEIYDAATARVSNPNPALDSIE